MSPGQHPTLSSAESAGHIRNVVGETLTSLRLAPGTPVLIAVSGGPDSLCLADVTIQLATQIGIKPIIAHLNHCLRGTDADEDAAFVAAYATAHGVPACIESANIRHLAQLERVSLEVAARHARYSFLQKTAVDVGAHHILIGHNADDQAETLLLRIIRGTGINGLRGMQVISPLVVGTTHNDDRIWLVRPLLTIPRSEISSYCQAQGLRPRADITNADTHYLRNHIRHDLLPLLEKMNPGIRKVLSHLSETAITDMEIVEYATQQAFRSVVQNEIQDYVTINRKGWQKLPVGLQRTVLRQAVMQVKQNTVDLKYSGVEEARDVLNSNASTGQIAILSDVRIAVTPADFTVKTVRD